MSRRDASPLPPLDNDPFTGHSGDRIVQLISITSESAASCAPASRARAACPRRRTCARPARPRRRAW